MGLKNIRRDICFRDDPTIPIVLYVKSIDQNPYKNRKYPNESIIYVNNQPEAEIQHKTVNQAQRVEFLNIKYLPLGVDDSGRYNPHVFPHYSTDWSRSLSFNGIFSCVLKVTHVLDDRTVNGFTKWYTYKKLKLMDATKAALRDIVMYLPEYQDSFRKMKEAGYEIIRYARSSKGKKDDLFYAVFQLQGECCHG
ncbi:hypothetical protein INT47_000579 [Mucor saturninus]|uniref:Uncharacterized protein n=1 Tax=Mucor saturninus TaxID=64648 RepID=A0A8H7VDL6_9FUNG|nr:hypothetical protein INT47_000579 [Mucor saturninus]